MARSRMRAGDTVAPKISALVAVQSPAARRFTSELDTSPDRLTFSLPQPILTSLLPGECVAQVWFWVECDKPALIPLQIGMLNHITIHIDHIGRSHPSLSVS